MPTALYFGFLPKLYYICFNFTERGNITLHSEIPLRKQYNLPKGKYSCGTARENIAVPRTSLKFFKKLC